MRVCIDHILAVELFIREHDSKYIKTHSWYLHNTPHRVLIQDRSGLIL